MESRLPKPKVVMKKAISALEVNRDFRELPEVSNALPATSKGLKAIGKSKSTCNITDTASDENKPLVSEPVLLRSKTTAVIARAGGSKPIKRLGTNSDAVETKRPNLRAVTKPPATQKTAPRAAVTSKVVNGTAKVAMKPGKWDTRSRLDFINAKLLTLKEKHKLCSQLANIVEELNAKGSTMTTRIEELEVSQATLVEEITSIKRDYDETLEKHESLRTELKESQESYDKISKALKKAEDDCASQKRTLEEHAAKVENLEKNLNGERQTKENLTEKVKELQAILHQIDKDRRVLHNVIQEMKGNIRVFCRVRPKISKESAKALCTINFIDECTIEVGRSGSVDTNTCGSKARGTKQEFSFDKVFPPNASQAEVFEELSLLVQSALDGYNVCVFAYGQTGSGKTYTMEGQPDKDGEGMIPRTVRHIFSEMKQFELLGWEYKIEASFLKIYNEQIVDLLDSQQKNHEIRMADSKGNDLYVSNLHVQEINSPEELHECLQIAQRNRAVAAIFPNER